MKRAATCYIDVVILIGVLLLPYCVYRYIGTITPDNFAIEMRQMLSLLVICSVCRSTPIYINQYHAIDVSILATITAVLLKGPYAATLLPVVSAFFTFEVDPSSGKGVSIYNTSFRKSAFNCANLMIAILLPGLLLKALGHTPGDVALPTMVVHMLVFTTTSFLLNSLIIYTMFALNGDIKPGAALDVMRSLVPNVLAAMPLGLLICFVFKQEGGYWVAVITLLPLMLARYAWKLYLEAQKQHYQLIHAFAVAMEAKDKYTQGHSRRVSRYASLIAHRMHLRPAMIETIEMASTLHDIGKIGIPDAILLKSSRLTDEEFQSIQTHPQIGVNIVKQVAFPSGVIEIIGHHHERFDGRGYPDGIGAGQLSIGAQILTVADAFDAMTSERPYRKAMPMQIALDRLVEEKGRQFNPDIVDCLISLSHEPEFEEVLLS